MNDLSYIQFAGVSGCERPFPSKSRWTFPARNNLVATELLPPRIPDSTQALVELNPFLDWLLQRVGINGTAYRPEALHRRIPACLRALRVSSTEAARTLLERKPELLARAANAVLIGVSEFFRDEGVFEFLGDQTLPELLEQKDKLRILSAGCSEGQELYSIAILLHGLASLNRCFLLGIDCRPAAIATAQSGWFNTADLNRMTAGQRSYFQCQGSRARISTCLREKVEWQTADLMTFESVEKWDLILYRNVGIYLEPTRGLNTWRNLETSLAPGGFLVTGKAERPPSSRSLRRVSPCIYRKHEESIP